MLGGAWYVTPLDPRYARWPEWADVMWFCLSPILGGPWMALWLGYVAARALWRIAEAASV